MTNPAAPNHPDIVPAEPQHLDLLKDAFDAQKSQRPAHYSDYLAKPALLDFHYERIAKRLQEGTAPSWRVAFSDDRLLALWGIEPSELHAQHFNAPCFKVNPFFCFEEDPALLAPLCQAIARQCQETGEGVFHTRVDSQQASLAYCLAEAGFLPSGTSVRMVLPAAQFPKNLIDTPIAHAYDEVVVRDAAPSDSKTIEEIGKTSHSHSHFFSEMRFAPSQAQALFGEWIRRCMGGLAHRVLAAEHQERLCGFCTLLINRNLHPFIQETIGVIDFIAVDTRQQSRGVGSALLAEALRTFQGEAGRVELRTMADNIRAIRFYEKHGFRFLSSDQHFHYWTPTTRQHRPLLARQR